MNLHPLVKLSFLSGLLMVSTHAFSQTDATDNATPAVITTTTTTENANTASPADDAAITHTLKKLINESKTLSKLNVQVSTTKGVVTLDGTVDSNTQASSLIEHAESIVGVSDVDTSKLMIKDGQQPLADTVITAKIKGLFIREELFGEKDIAAINTSVETKDGVVYLSGVVENQAQIDNAIELIKKNIPEVKKVEYSVKKVTPVNK